MTVPIDRSGGVPGTIDLAVYRAPARGPSRGILLALPGGPGDGGLAHFARRLAAFDEARGTHDLVFVDPRGTGRSGLLDCPDAESCARRLGPASRFYTSRDVADDAEAVRAAIGAERIALYGISQGGWYTQTYARRYPERVSALVLDAPVTRAIIDDPFSRGSFAALPSVLRALCPASGCARDPYADVAALVRRLRGTELLRLSEAAATLDVNPAVRVELAAAVAARLRGDGAPLGRLVEGALLPARPNLARFSPGANVAGACEEHVLPWPRTMPPGERLAEAQRRLAEIPPAAFAPFDPSFALFGGFALGCLGWPAAADSPIVDGELPPVPALVLTGDADVRVPAAGARELAASLPGARLLIARHVGHGVLGEEPTGCASRAVAALLNGAASADCAPAGLAPRPPFARRLAEVPAQAVDGVSGKRRRRIVAAAVLTATDALNQAALRIDAGRHDFPVLRFRGLRGGSARGSVDRVRLHRAAWVPGVRVSGVARADGRHVLRLGGAARGTLRVTGARVRGRLAGVAIRGTLDLAPLGGAGIAVREML